MDRDEMPDMLRATVLTVLERRLRERGADVDALLPPIGAAMDAGSTGALRECLSTCCAELAGDTSVASFTDAVVALSLAMPPLRGENMRIGELAALSAAAAAVATAAEALASGDMAYNLHEFAWTCADAAEQPALGSAIALRRLADPQRPDQVRACAWRLAIDRLRDAIERGQGWLDAVNAVELALTLPVEPAVVQQHYFERLRALAMQLGGTPIESLVIALHVQAPTGCLPEPQRSGVIQRLLGLRDPLPPGAPSDAAHFLACINAQAMVDDERLKLLAPPPLRPGIAWHDLSLAHEALQAAVPLGRSLLADPERTGEFLLTLVHEAAHAFCLLGPAGVAASASRAALSYLEFLLIERAATVTGNPVDARAATPLPRLPADAVAVALARAQVATVRRSIRFAAAWTAWLEGVALYVELLADPAQDADEIIAPHSVVRSLVDFGLDASPSDDPSAAERRALELAIQFERFASAALARYSRLRHMAALVAGPGSRVYLPGYLLVRMLVARWEATLGRRVAPLHAARLLLDATRMGAFDALPAFDAPLDVFGERCREGIADFVTALARIDAPTLDALLGGQRPRPRHAWSGGQPRPSVAGDDARWQASADARGERLVDEVAAVALGGGCPSAASNAEAAVAWRRHRDGVAELVSLQMQLATLLPVGRDDARLLLFPDSRRIATCPRTFAGIGPALPACDDLNIPRYSIRNFVTKNPGRDFERIRAGCVATGTARARMTRVVDLVGHAGAPVPVAGASYVCASIGGHWDHVAVGYSPEPIDEGRHAAFLSLLRARLLPHPFHAAEGTTLASPAFLASRLATLVPDDEGAAALAAFDAEECAANDGAWLLATALTLGQGAVADAVDRCSADAAAAQALSNALWATGTGSEAATRPPACSLAAMILDASARPRPFHVPRSG